MEPLLGADIRKAVLLHTFTVTSELTLSLLKESTSFYVCFCYHMQKWAELMKILKPKMYLYWA